VVAPSGGTPARDGDGASGVEARGSGDASIAIAEFESFITTPGRPVSNACIEAASALLGAEAGGDGFGVPPAGSSDRR
jgi:hypothetical protein